MKKILYLSCCIAGMAWAQFVENEASKPPRSAYEAFHQQSKSTQDHFQSMLQQAQALAQSEEMKKLVEEGKQMGAQIKTELQRDTSEMLMGMANLAQSFSQQVSPDRAPTAKPQQDNNKIDPKAQGVAYVRQLPHGSLVRLNGVIERRVQGEHPYKYWFSDGFERVMVEIEPEVWRKQKVTPSTPITIWAEVERVRSSNAFKELEVDYLELLKP